MILYMNEIVYVYMKKESKNIVVQNTKLKRKLFQSKNIEREQLYIYVYIFISWQIWCEKCPK